MTLDRLLKQHHLADASNVAIRQALIEGLSDASEYVRINSIVALGHYPDTEVRAHIERVASSDDMRRSVDGKTVYRVREAAARWLKEHR